MLKVKGLLSFLCFLTSNSLIALPSGGNVINGQAELLPFVNTLQVSANGKAILHWDQFDIASHEAVRFIQLQSGQAILNRVTSETASEILGVLKANCPIYLINPQGIFIGSGACIDTAGFLASTANLSNEAFWQGSEMLFQDFGKGCIVNLGKISATDGDVFLIARAVDNQGRIEAKNGAAIVATQEVMLHSDTKQCVFIRADQSGLEEEGIQNSGAIEALAIKLKTQSPYERAIHHTGSMQALTTLNQDGRIYLVADQGEVSVDGTLVAQSGEVRALGRKVYVENEAVIDVSGAFGGTVLIGGDTQGKNPDILNAQEISVAKGAQIRADAVLDGDGGKVILWADQKTSVFGAVSAEGGKKSGNGGFVEISAKSNDWHYGGTVSTKAPFGKSGTLLLDPSNISITTSNSSPAFTNPYNPAVPSANLKASDLETALASSNVIISTSNGTGGTTSGAVTIAANVTWATDQSLTILADQSVNINIGFTVSNTFVGTPTNDPLINFQANLSELSTGSATGFNILAATLQTASGSIYIEAIGTGGGGGVVIGASSVITDSGNITLIGTSGLSSGVRGLSVDNARITSTNGNINLRGISRSDGNTAHGLNVIHTSYIQTLGSGNINLTGMSIGANTNATAGFFLNTLATGGKVQALGTGSISLTGTTNSFSNAGVNIFGPVSVTSGTITMNGAYTGSSLASGSIGVWIGTGAVSATTGGVFLTGNAGVSGTGIFMNNGSITTTSGNIVLNGTGGHVTGAGIFMTNSSFGMNTTDGSITFTGIGQGTSSGSPGISVASGAKAQVTGVGTFTLNGVGGNSSSGVLVDGSGSIVSSNSGVITINGTGGSAGTNCRGLQVSGSAKISSTSGMITGTCTGGAGTSGCAGIFVTGSGSAITTATGGINLTGTGGGTTTSNQGISLAASGMITTTNNAPITLLGTGSSLGTGSNEGIFMTNSATTISTATGAIQMTGVAGGGSTNGITVDTSAAVFSSTAGPITLASANNNVSVQNNGGIKTQGVGGPGANDISIASKGLSVAGGAAGGSIISTVNGNVAVASTGLVSITGGTANNSFGQITVGNSANKVGIQMTGLTLTGGSGSGAFAEISTSGGLLSIDGAGAVSLTGGSNANTEAQIITKTNAAAGDAIYIGRTVMPTTLTLQGGSGGTLSRAVIASNVGGNILCRTSGNWTITGGSGTGDSRAGIFSGLASGSGNISAIGASLSLTGGSNTGTNDAQISAPVGGGSVMVAASGAVLLNGGTAANQNSFIQTLGNSGSNPISLTCGVLSLSGSTTVGASNAAAGIKTALGNIGITVSGNIVLAGGKASATNALIQSTTQGAITVSSTSTSIEGGTGAGTTGILTQAGDISITCSQNLQCSAPNSGALAAIQTSGSNVTATVGGSINLSGSTTISMLAPTGDILMIAGQNISIGTSVQITNNGTANSSLKLVVDNDFPTAPSIGPGQFILDSGATISAPGSPPVKIYTAKRFQNSINSPINGEAFVPGPFGIDTPTEQWSSYYPTDPAAPAFTIYYKEPQSIAPFAPVIFNNIGANLIQLARLLPILRPALNLARGHYHFQFCDEANGLPCDPTFSPYGSFIFEDDIYWIGAGFE